MQKEGRGGMPSGAKDDEKALKEKEQEGWKKHCTLNDIYRMGNITSLDDFCTVDGGPVSAS